MAKCIAEGENILDYEQVYNDVRADAVNNAKKLSPADQVKCTKANTAVAVLQENTSLIKRPIVTKKGKIIAIGFDPATYATLF